MGFSNSSTDTNRDACGENCMSNKLFANHNQANLVASIGIKMVQILLRVVCLENK